MATVPRPRRPRVLPAVLAVLVGAAVLVLPSAGPAGSAVAAGETGSLLFEDSFTGQTLEDPDYLVGGARDGGTTGWTPCLTAGTSSTATPVPGCGVPADPDGEGALRLTPAENGTSGFLVYDREVPLRAGVDITFTSYQWGGNGADGISFFLADGSRSLTRVGGYGGALGYSNRGNDDGVPGGLLGVGLDAYGNWPLEPRNSGCATTPGAVTPRSTASSDYAYHVAVRGDGDGKRGYCLLGEPAEAEALRTTGTVRPGPVVARVVVDPPADPSPEVTVYLDGTEVTSVPQPAVLASTSTFRFGWGSSTGGLNDTHEIGMVRMRSVDPLGPDLRLTAAGPTGLVPSGEPAPLGLTARVQSASGPLPAGEPVVVTAPAPQDASFDEPSGDGWDCSSTTPARLRCTWSSASAVRSGTTLPVLTAPVRSARSGRQEVTASVTSASDEQEVTDDNEASAQARFVPGVEPLDAGEVDAAPDPVALVAALGTDARPEVTTRSVGTASSVGEVAPGTGAQVVLRPAAGASGLLRGAVTVTDGEGVTSPEASVLLTVRPVAPPVAGRTTSGEQVVLPPPSAPVGSGPFRYELVAAGSPDLVDRAEVDAATGVVTVVPAEGASGRAVLSYRVVGADDVASAPASVTVDVRPTGEGEVVRVPQDAAGEGEVAVRLPEPRGTGPFTYRLVGTPSGPFAAELDADGVLRLTAAPGRSGTGSLSYLVEDASGVASDPVAVAVRVAPHVVPARGTGTASAAAVTSSTPAVVGTGPFRFAVVQQPDGGASAVVDAATGVVTLDPHGRAGRFTVAVTARDAEGVVGDPAVVELVVAPDARDVLARTAVTRGGTPVRLRPVVLGAPDAALVVTRRPDPADGSVEVDGEDLVVTPAPGFSGRLVVGYEATGAGVTSATAEAVVEVAPAAAPATADAVSGRRAEVPLPDAVGRGPFTYRLAEEPDPAVATASVRDARVVLEPARTWSGVLRLGYVAVDADGLASEPAELLVTVAPAAPALSAAGVAAATDPQAVVGPTPQPAGSGPFTFALVDAPPATQGTASTDPSSGVTTFVPAPGWSGVAPASYRVVDANGLPSEASPVALVVRPSVTGLPDVAARAGETVVLTPPAAVGTGPFRWALGSVPPEDEADVEIDPATGEVTVRPAAGHVGSVVLAWTVTDAAGLVSSPAQVVVRVSAAAVVEPAPAAPSPPAVPPTSPSPRGGIPTTGPGAGPVTAPTPLTDPATTTTTSTTSVTATTSTRSVTATTATTSPATTTTASSTGGTPPASSDVVAAGPRRLARTGQELLLPVLLGSLLVVGGAGLRAAARRRRRVPGMLSR